MQARRPLAVRASATASSSYTRVLRYPNGYERRIRYPVVSKPLEDAAPRTETTMDTKLIQEEVTDYDWLIDDTDDSSNPLNWDECDLWGASCNPAFVQEAEPVVEVSVNAVPLSFEQELSLQAASIAELVSCSYKVLCGSPWLLPRPLHVLATSSRSMHCLQVRFEKEGVLDELSTFLKRPELASKLTVFEMKDGVVAFETAEDAARYATFLEADMDDEVDVLSLDSNELFLSTNEVDAVVVFLAGGNNFLPMPYQLANALRSSNASLE